MNTTDVKVEPDNLSLDLPEDLKIVVVAGGPGIAGIAIGEQAAVNYTIFNRLLGLNPQNPQLQGAVTSILCEQPRQPAVVEDVI